MGTTDAGARQTLSWLSALGISAVALWLVAAVAPQLPLPARLAYAVAFAAVSGSALATGRWAPQLGVVAAVAGALAAAAALFLVPLSPPGSGPAGVVTLALLAGGSLLGAALGARVERPGHLCAVALVSSFADLWSVLDSGAPSAELARQIAAEGPGSLSRWVLPWPMLGTPLIEPVLGVGDVVFVALYLGTARAHGLSTRRMVLALAGGFFVGLAGVLALARPVPLLPLLGGAVLLAEPRARVLAPRERRLLLLVTAGALVCLLVRFR